MYASTGGLTRLKCRSVKSRTRAEKRLDRSSQAMATVMRVPQRLSQ